MKKNKNNILEIYPNGDPSGGGFQASLSNDGGVSWFFLGGESPNSREFWRDYARNNNCILRHRY